MNCPPLCAREQGTKMDAHVVAQDFVKNTKGAFFELSERPPLFPLYHIQHLGKTIPQGMEKTIIGAFAGAAVAGMAGRRQVSQCLDWKDNLKGYPTNNPSLPRRMHTDPNLEAGTATRVIEFPYQRRACLH